MLYVSIHPGGKSFVTGQDVQQHGHSLVLVQLVDHLHVPFQRDVDPAFHHHAAIAEVAAEVHVHIPAADIHHKGGIQQVEDAEHVVHRHGEVVGVVLVGDAQEAETLDEVEQQVGVEVGPGVVEGPDLPGVLLPEDDGGGGVQGEDDDGTAGVDHDVGGLGVLIEVHLGGGGDVHIPVAAPHDDDLLDAFVDVGVHPQGHAQVGSRTHRHDGDGLLCIAEGLHQEADGVLGLRLEGGLGQGEVGVVDADGLAVDILGVALVALEAEAAGHQVLDHGDAHAAVDGDPASHELHHPEGIFQGTGEGLVAVGDGDGHEAIFQGPHG